MYMPSKLTTTSSQAQSFLDPTTTVTLQGIAATSGGERSREPRELEECKEIHRSSHEGARQLTDEELVMLVQEKVKRLLF